MESLREVLTEADRNRVAVGHFNFSEVAAFNAIVAAARNLRVPVMLGVSEGEREFFGVAQAAAIIRSVRESDGLSIYLNADHTHSIEKAEAAARAGFDEIIFDGSAKPLEENIADTKRAVEAIKPINSSILVEGEIGYIGASSEILDKPPEGMTLTTPEEARQFVAETGVNVLAPAVGNMHGARRKRQTPRSRSNCHYQAGGQNTDDPARRLGHRQRRFPSRDQGRDDYCTRQYRVAACMAAQP